MFRSRDVRNNRNRRKGENGAVADGKSCFIEIDGGIWIDLIGLSGIGKKQVEETTSPKKGYYDPVRNGTL